MRYVLMIAALVANSAIAEDQPFDIQVGCTGPDIVIQVAMAKPGVLTFKVPHDYCGSDV